ncbi:MAG TPA: BON domain-containing protein [Bryobacteraceae bacterium]|nr:BON domain-containing protein [Bryobacteraceae bacterium]
MLLFAFAALVFAADKTPVSDDALYDAVRMKLANDPIVKGGALTVEVKNGVVTLRGNVETEKQREKAPKVARKVKGVTQVVNELKVVSRAPQ